MMKIKINKKLLAKKILIGILGVILFIGVWNIFSIKKSSPIFPDFIIILKSLVKNISSTDFSIHFFSSMKIIFLGIILAIVVGFSLGLLMEEIDFFNFLISPLFNSLRGIAGISLFPILIVVFGLSDLPRIIIVFWTAIPSILIGTFRNLEKVDKELIEAGQIFGASKGNILWRIKLPLALDGIIGGIKIGLGGGWISLVVAEMLASTKGLGYMLSMSSSTFRFADSYSYIIIITMVLGIITSVLDMISKLINNKLF